MLGMLSYVIPLIVSPFVLIIFSIITAYVLSFNIKGTGLGFDYMIFTLIILVGLYMGGAL